MRIIIVGFDGLDYYRVLKYLDYLPTFKRLKNFMGRLESTIPPSTAPAWVSMFTGVTPGEHGIYGFINIETRKVMNYNDIKAKKLWDRLKDVRFCIINVPMTYPPDKDINGLIVSGFPTYVNDLRKIVYPPRWLPILKKIKLPKDIDEVEFRRKYYKNREAAFRNLLSLMDLRARSYLKLLSFKEFDIFWFVFRETDIIQHFYRDEKKIVETYKKADEILSKFLIKAKEDWLIVVSDHGHNTVERVIYVDNLIKTYICKYSCDRSIFDKLIKPLIINRVISLVWKYPLLIDFATKVFGNREIIKTSFEGIIYNSDSWSLNVDDEELRDKIIQFLSNIKDKKGKKLFLKVLRGKELYKNAKVRLPDIFFLPNYGFYPLSGSKFGRSDIIDIPRDPSHHGTHTLNGIYLLYNRNASKIPLGKEAKIWEIAKMITSLEFCEKEELRND